VATLAPAYVPRRPTDTVLCGLVRQNLGSFLAYAREHYDGGLPRYVEAELRAYLKCGVFSEGFTRCHCDTCRHDLLVAFSCKSRTVCPSCAGRRMANTAAAIVDRVLPDVPVRQYVLSLPYELRRLAAFRADVLTALGRGFVDAVFASYRQRAQRRGIADGQCGAINFVQRFGSMNLNVHFHVVVLDGVFARDADARVQFHAAPPPAREELDAIVRRTRDRAVARLRRRGLLADGPGGDGADDRQTALDACATIAIGRGQVATLANADARPHDAHDEAPDGPSLAVDLDGFNLHAGVRIAAGDDLGRERLCRYGARPPLSLERLRRLPGRRVAYRLKYVGRGRGKHRVMSAMEFMARLAALIARVPSHCDWSETRHRPGDHHAASASVRGDDAHGGVFQARSRNRTPLRCGGASARRPVAAAVGLDGPRPTAARADDRRSGGCGGRCGAAHARSRGGGLQKS
jgi:hypothetical protein